MTDSARLGRYVLLWTAVTALAITLLSCDNTRSKDRSRPVWSEDAVHVYTTTAKNIGIGTKNPSAPFSVFRNGSNISGTGFAVAAFDPKNPDKGVWLGYDANSVTGIIGADSDGKTASELSFWTHDGSAHGERARLASNGNFGFGTPDPQEKVHITGNLRVQGNTDCVIGKSAGGISCSSDERLKDNVQTIKAPLEKILSLRGVEFEWNGTSASPRRHDMGLIAQDVEKVFPSAVVDMPDGSKNLDYAVLVAPIIESVKELDNHLGRLRDKELTDLRERNAALTGELNMIKAWACAKDPSAGWCSGKE